ncbi:MAG: DedA family protein [Anaerolineae bacterium]
MPPELEHAIVDFLTTFIQGIGWFGIVVIMALESANIPIPSEVTMPLAGWLLIEAQGGTWVEALLLGGLFGGLGCLIGSIASYTLGAWGGRPFLEKYGKYIFINPHDLDKADRWFARWGDWASFLSRLLPIVRTFISFPAGVARIRFWSFSVLTFVGSFIWCGLLAVGGYALGANWEELRAVMRPFDYPIAAVLVIGFAYYIYRHIKHARAAYPANPEGEVSVSED